MLPGLLIAAALGLSGCSGGGHNGGKAIAAAQDGVAGYVRPPKVLSAQRLGDAVVIRGLAQPNSRVRLVGPDGQAFGGTAGADGRWTMPAPTPQGAQLYALGEDVGGRVVRAEGAVVALPRERPAALLRAGVGALAMDSPSKRLQLGAVDFDGGGWAFISGMASPDSRVRLQIDSAPWAEVKADVEGRFTLPLKPNDLPPGSHRLRAQSGSQSAAADVVVSAAGPISGPPFRALRQGAAWRIDWRTPGGGVQTSLVLDP